MVLGLSLSHGSTDGNNRPLSRMLGPLISGNSKTFLLASMPQTNLSEEQMGEATMTLDVAERAASFISTTCRRIEINPREEIELTPWPGPDTFQRQPLNNASPTTVAANLRSPEDFNRTVQISYDDKAELVVTRSGSLGSVNKNKSQNSNTYACKKKSALRPSIVIRSMTIHYC